MEEKEKWEAVSLVNKELSKQFETEKVLVRLGDRVGVKWPSISTGISSFDEDVSGTGGIPRGRIIEVYGPESSGKTTFALHLCAQEQKNGLVAYIDAEHSLDPSYMHNLGVDVSNLIVSQPDSGEQALDTVIALVESKAVSLIIVDSVSALVPRAELEGDMGESHMGLQARLMSQAMRKLRGICAINQVTVVFINQIREKIGVMFGNPETTSGGKALKFYASMRLDIRRIGGDKGKVTDGDEAIGHKMKIKAVKNKMGIPSKECIIDLIYGKGFDLTSDLIDYALNQGVIHKSGGWIKFDGENYRKEEFTESLIKKIKKRLDELHTTTE